MPGALKPHAHRYLLFILLCLLCCLTLEAQEAPKDGEDPFARFADPEEIWGKGVESIIEGAYRRCFKTYILGGRVMNLRIPFAENYEREGMTTEGWEFLGGGKLDPSSLWEHIDGILSGADFAAYEATLRDGREKVIIFDIPSQTWKESRDLFDIARMRAGAYRGLPHRPYVLRDGLSLRQSDVYNYLYCVGWTGMDCSGFVWYILSELAKAGGVDLGRSLSRTLGVPRGAPAAFYVGTWFFNSRSREIRAVSGKIGDLKPADVLLFRGKDGDMVHSAIIQSVDMEKGVVRYLQSTDEAPLDERGVHDSYIYFDPHRGDLDLKDHEVIWTQERFAPFPGERPSAFSDDGKRFRAYGGGRVVRLATINSLIRKLR